MIVTSVCVGHHVTGLKVGAKNARRYFPKGTREIELQLDHLRIECGLAPNFWQQEPEIHDRRLCLWLESKQWKENVRAPAQFAMIPFEENFFTLRPIDRKDAKHVRGERRDAHGNKHDA